MSILIYFHNNGSSLPPLSRILPFHSHEAPPYTHAPLFSSRIFTQGVKSQTSSNYLPMQPPLPPFKARIMKYQGIIQSIPKNPQTLWPHCSLLNNTWTLSFFFFHYFLDFCPTRWNRPRKRKKNWRNKKAKLRIGQGKLQGSKAIFFYRCKNGQYLMQSHPPLPSPHAYF